MSAWQQRQKISSRHFIDRLFLPQNRSSVEPEITPESMSIYWTLERDSPATMIIWLYMADSKCAEIMENTSQENRDDVVGAEFGLVFVDILSGGCLNFILADLAPTAKVISLS